MTQLPSEIARTGGRDVLRDSLQNARHRTLALLHAYTAKLGDGLNVEYSTQLNPPRWEAGHIGWFQDFWIARNQQRALGLDADPDHERPAGRLSSADAWYNSSKVAHTTRWQLPLPDVADTLSYLTAGLEETLALLARTPETDRDLYFFRLVLFHEDMHNEAGTYMAQALGIELPNSLRPQQNNCRGLPPISMPGGSWMLGYDAKGFAFDNECPAHRVELAPYRIDAEVMNWEHYLPYVQATGIAPPRYLRHNAGQWERQHFGRWEPLPLAAPATHLTWVEAQGWCDWAGYRLPTETEWEMAACTRSDFLWGEVWEWTSSRFVPFDGFVPHPYRDYSAPWFHERYVLRGASRATSPRMAHPRYRNFFTPERNDIHIGFRACRS